jgi:cAMP-dependent protein kinase regulator/cGMP-dependent protein kinase 2
MMAAFVYEPLKSFGEKSLINQKPRAGTTKCLTDCFFALVSKESYEYVLRRVEMESSYIMMTFLKQIPYIRGWISREVAQMKYLMKSETYLKRGTVLAKEGSKCTKVFIFREGEFEVVKENLNNVYYNSHAGTVAIGESDGKTLIKSNF